MENSKEEEPVFLDRASRGTRGKRMTKLLDEEIEEDELFWNQEALKDEEHDDNYEEEGEVADEFDSDFDEDEPEPDEEGEKEPDDRAHTKKRLVPPGKTVPKKKKKTKDLSQLGSASKDESIPEEEGMLQEQRDSPEGVKEERIVRKSTRTAVVVRQAERDAIQAALQATVKPIIKKKKEGEEKRMTQEEMLLEAAQTEIMNIRNLERVLAREEEVKKRAIVHKAVYTGPQIRYTSKNGCNYLEFRGLPFDSEIPSASVPYPEKAVCVVTGLPAKYKDPKTGLPYANKEAFKIIRERYSNENSRREMHTGKLHDALSGLGFLGRQKRSDPSGKGSSRQWSYFGQIPASESPSMSQSLSLSSD
uniref:Vps72/YL1 C-terminal domain-containing protein n=1 Tax=Kalanchoe fedtschenkoi TaxID=63787 RepID=A0A7N0UGN1_KALFE